MEISSLAPLSSSRCLAGLTSSSLGRTRNDSGQPSQRQIRRVHHVKVTRWFLKHQVIDILIIIDGKLLRTALAYP